MTVSIDRAMRWGFRLGTRGQFETWDALGREGDAARMEAAGYVVPGWVNEQIAAQGEGMRFYRQEPDSGGGTRRLVQLDRAGGHKPVPGDPRQIALDAVRAAGGEIERNPSASLLDLGDGVFCLEFHAKMNALDPDIVAMTFRAVDRGRTEGVALGLATTPRTPSARGANCFR